MAKLELIHLEKKYPNGYHALKDINLAIEDGEFIVIVGPSGCGKSTLMRMVAGLEEVTTGQIKIGGVVVDHLEPAQRDISMVFQNYALYPHMSVFGNMSYGLKIAKLPSEEIKKRVEEIATLLGLTHLLDRKPRELSGGQRQRVAMGRAIVRNPKVFLFDEPLSNLDTKLRIQMRLEIKKLHQKLGVTSLYVTHDQVEAMTLADRIVVLNEGRIEQVGTPDQIFNNPDSYFVADFMGSPPMNLLEVQLNEQGEIKGDNYCIPLAGSGALAPRRPGSFYLGIRPEHLVVSESGLPMKVEMIESLGAEDLIHLSFEGKPYVMSQKRKDMKMPLYEKHIRVWVNNISNLRFFDQSTRRRITE